MPAVMKLIGVPKAERSGVFNDVRCMEAEALAIFAEQSDRNK